MRAGHRVAAPGVGQALEGIGGGVGDAVEGVYGAPPSSPPWRRRGAVALALAGPQRVEGDVARDAGQPGAQGLAGAEPVSTFEGPLEGLVGAIVDVGVVATEPQHGGDHCTDVRAQLRRAAAKARSSSLGEHRRRWA